MDRDSILERPQGKSSGLDFNTADSMTKNKKENQHPKKKQKIASDESVSALHRRVEDLSRLIEQEPIVDIEKVNAIKAAIRAGTYQIDANTVADKLMELEFELNKPKPKP